jgi:hypothetical protein
LGLATSQFAVLWGGSFFWRHWRFSDPDSVIICYINILLFYLSSLPLETVACVMILVLWWVQKSSWFKISLMFPYMAGNVPFYVLPCWVGMWKFLSSVPYICWQHVTLDTLLFVPAIKQGDQKPRWTLLEGAGDRGHTPTSTYGSECSL